MKTRSFQTIGVPVPLPGRFTFQRTFSVSLHVVGGLATGATPVPCGPRHCGQAACVEDGAVLAAGAPGAWTEAKQQSPAAATAARGRTLMDRGSLFGRHLRVYTTCGRESRTRSAVTVRRLSPAWSLYRRHAY